MDISQDRLQHSIGVARKMYEISLQRGGNIEEAQKMFILGFVHDVGYEFCKTQNEHADVGAEILKLCGFQYSDEVKYHGKVQNDYSSEELYILNVADFLVGSDGRPCSAEDRLEGIAQRYGENTSQYIEATRLAKELNLI